MLTLIIISIFVVTSLFLRFNGGIAKPSSVLPLYFLCTVVVGFFGFNVFSFAYGMPFELGDKLPLKNFEIAGLNILIAILSYSLGSLVINRKRRNDFIVKKTYKYGLASSVFLIFLPAFFLISSYGLDLIYRYDYIPENIGIFKFLGKVTLVLLLFNLRNITKSNQLILFVYTLYTVILIGYASRMLALLPIVNLISSIDQNKRYPLTKTILSAFLTWFFVVIVIELRKLDIHGIVPYFQHLLLNGIDFSFGKFGINYLTSFTYSLTAYLVDNIETNFEFFMISIDPRFGFHSGWLEIKDQLRVNKYVPYNGLSELAAMGYWILSIYFFISGLLIKWIENSLRKIELGNVVVFAFAGLFTIEIAQYNLRSATRLIYYLLVVYIMYLIIKNLINMLPKK